MMTPSRQAGRAGAGVGGWGGRGTWLDVPQQAGREGRGVWMGGGRGTWDWGSDGGLLHASGKGGQEVGNTRCSMWGRYGG